MTEFLNDWGISLMVFLPLIGAALMGDMVLGIGQTLTAWCVGAFFAMFYLPFINGSNQAIWQAKVAPDVQGRVFSARRLIAQIAGPIGILLAGPLSDNIFEPAMMPDGAWAPYFGWLVGTGPGAGMGLLILFLGVMGVLTGLSGYAIRSVRDAETILPDHDLALESK